MLRRGLVRLDVLYKVLREGITDTMAFEQKPEERRGNNSCGHLGEDGARWTE